MPDKTKDNDVKEVPLGDDAPLDPNDPAAKEAMSQEMDEAKEAIGGAEDDD